MFNVNQTKINSEKSSNENLTKAVNYFSGGFFPVINHPIPQLPLLDAFVDRCIKNQLLPNLETTLVVGVQHMLITTVSLLKSIIDLGILPENMYFSGKSYSSSAIVENEIFKLGINLIGNVTQEKVGEFEETFYKQIKELWKRVECDLKGKRIDKIIIIDDGGCCLELLPDTLKLKYPIIGVEQTRGGFYSEGIKILPFPVIDIATAAAKKVLISPFIADAVLKKVKEYFKQFENKHDQIVCGVIGNGSIGNAITTYLLSMHFKVWVYDENSKSFNMEHTDLHRAKDIEMLIGNSQIIFGCTGRDVTENIDIISLINKDKYFISCSSKDKEFLSLLKQIAKHIEKGTDPLSDIVFHKDQTTKITIVQGGFPINFDRSPESVPASEIALARGLMLGAFVQALLIPPHVIYSGTKENKPGEKYQIDPYIQRFIVSTWWATQSNNIFNPNIKAFFHNISWLINNSGGHHEDLGLQNVFGLSEVTHYYSPAKL